AAERPQSSTSGERPGASWSPTGSCDAGPRGSESMASGHAVERPGLSTAQPSALLAGRGAVYSRDVDADLVVLDVDHVVQGVIDRDADAHETACADRYRH